MKRRSGMGAAFVITVAGGVLAMGCESAPCPATPPTRGEACESPAGGQCTWTSPCPPYAPVTTTARCESGRWEVSYDVSCNPPSLWEDAGRADALDAAGPTDASADSDDAADARAAAADATDAPSDLGG